MNPTYLDCNATTPLDPEVRDVLFHFLTEEYGNEGSRTHSYGASAKQAVQRAREQIAKVVDAQKDEVVFTSGATESNNLAILGLSDFGLAQSQNHVITTSIEHKAVLEPYERLQELGFEVTLLPVGESGAVDPEAVAKALRPETMLVSIMHVNNETGIRQPLEDISEVLGDHHAYFHTDAAQGFGKDLNDLRNQRLDLISISGHKIFGPKGVGALVTRRRGYDRPPLKPLVLGGGQEKGLRPGTLPVALIAALGQAADSAVQNHEERIAFCRKMRTQMLSALEPLNPLFSGDQHMVLPHVANFRFPGMNSEALMVALKDLVAISNGSACTSSSYSPSHVLKAMGMTDDAANECVRVSWSHLTPEVDWEAVANRVKRLI